MIQRLVLCTALIAMSGTAEAARKRAPAGVAVVTSGSEQALKLGPTVLSRPFGAQLVDRIAVAGTYRAKGRAYYLIRGEASADCPVRFVVVTSEVDGSPAVSEPFGTCSAAARGEIARTGFVVTMPATVAGGPPVRFRYENGKMRLLDARPASQVASLGGMIGYGARAASTCRAPTSADPGAQALVVTEFRNGYPAEYRKISSLKRVTIPPEELRATVTGLACLARWPGAERVVPEAATPLFASERYGHAAFALLDTIAQDPLSDINLRAAVRAFNTEMIYRVDRREPL